MSLMSTSQSVTTSANLMKCTDRCMLIFCQISTQLKEQGLNSELYYKNKELRKVISVIPTSAISGEGVPDILMLLVQLTQKLMEDKLMYISEVQVSVCIQDINAS